MNISPAFDRLVQDQLIDVIQPRITELCSMENLMSLDPEERLICCAINIALVETLLFIIDAQSRIHDPDYTDDPHRFANFIEFAVLSVHLKEHGLEAQTRLLSEAAARARRYAMKLI